MKPWQVTLVTALGRGESLALSLIDKGFSVRILDLTLALPEFLDRGAGPFPLVEKTFLPEHGHIFESAEALAHGLAFWLPKGPIELGGPMADFYLRTRRDVQVWKNDESTDDFESGWLRRFVRQWAAPVLAQPWVDVSGEAFPAAENLKLIPSTREDRILAFDRVKALGHECHECRAILDVQTEARNLQRLEVESGRDETFESERWIWCLSAMETRALNAKVAEAVLPPKTPTADWVWMRINGRSQRGPWTEGLPEFVVLFEDIYLPWVYANTAVMRRLEGDRYAFWMKVPWERVHNADTRRKWAVDLNATLQKRLPQAKWEIDSENWSVSSHAWIYSSGFRSSPTGQWKNWHWLAPETVSSLDPASYFQLEVEVFQDLLKWRMDQIKKKEGAKRDRALHAP